MNEQLLERFLAGDRVALARAISLVENLRPGFGEFLHAVAPRLGSAHRIGVTGPPGAGKSTITSRLTAGLRARDERVGILAVDPTSSFTGGALLGDRIRMNALSTDPGVFIRSTATRGALGGLATTSDEIADLLDAFGFDRVITETVGVGQSELDIAAVADTTIVVLVPESGDAIQTMKAGLMEIADLFVVNKADRPGADRLVRELETMLHLGGGRGAEPAGHHGVHPRMGGASRPQSEPEPPDAWATPVLKTIAHADEGIEALLTTIDRHRDFLARSGELERRRRRRLAERTRAAVQRELTRILWKRGQGEEILRRSMEAMESGAESPYSVAERIIRSISVPGSSS